LICCTKCGLPHRGGKLSMTLSRYRIFTSLSHYR